MKIKVTPIILVLSVFLSISYASATTYYVSSSSGNDSNNGTSQSTPWQSLNKVNSMSFTAGDNILFKSGDTWYGTLNINNSGVSGNLITYYSYGAGAKPVITGFKTITNWTSVGNGVYEATDPAFTSNMVNMVTLNGNFQAIGRWPKVTASNKGYLTVNSHAGSNSLTSSDLSGAPNVVGGQVVYRGAHWILNRGTITSQNSSTISFTPESAYFSDAYPPKDGYGFFVQNDANLLTTLGDWSYDTNARKFYMYFGSNSPSSYNVKVSTLDNLISINQNNTSHLIVNGLSLVGANTNAVNTTGYSNTDIQLTNLDISYTGTDAVDFSMGGQNNITISNNNINYTNDNGIRFSHNSSYLTITNNNISNTGVVAGMGVSGDGRYNAITDTGDNTTISNNNIINTGYLGINFGGKNTLVQNNFLNYACTVKDDCGAIYFGRGDYTGSKILNNIAINIPGAKEGTNDESVGTGEGIYADDSAYGAEIGGNTVAMTGYASIYIHAGYNLNIHDNTLYDAPYIMSYYNDNNTTANISQANNIFFAKTASQYLFRSSGGSTNPPGYFSSSDNNYFLRPLNDNNSILVSSPTYGLYNLASWKTYTGKETNSKASPVSISSTNQIFFDYNPSYNIKTVYLSGNYINLDGQSVTSPINIPAWGSVILLQTSGSVVSNINPTANAGTDKSITLPTNYTTLSGSGSDSDGSISSYSWSRVSGSGSISSPSSATTNITDLTAGTSVFRLTVTDNKGSTASDDVSVVVNQSINNNPTPTTTNSVVTIYKDCDYGGYSIPLASGNYNTNTLTSLGMVNNDISSLYISTGYQATLYDGDNYSGSYITLTNNAPCLIDNNYNDMMSSMIISKVSSTPTPDTTKPIISAFSIPSTSNSLTISISTLTASDNISVTGYILTESSIAPSATAIGWSSTYPSTYTFSSTGAKILYAWAKDAAGNVSNGVSGTTNISISTTNLPPTANAGTDKSITLPTNYTTLSGSGSDSDGSISSYSWSRVSGSGSISSPSSATTNITDLTAGTSVFRLTVTDNKGSTASDDVSVVVNQSINNNPTPYDYVTINTKILNVRSAPSLNSKILTKVRLGNIVQVIEVLNGWLKIKTQNGIEGYISAYYTSPVNTTASNDSTKIDSVMNSNIINDSNSDLTNNTNAIPADTNVNNRTPIYNSIPTTNTDNSSTPNNTTNTSTNSSSPNYVVINTPVLNVRSNPGLNSQILAKVRLGNKVEVVEVLNGWLKIKSSGGNYAYISSDYTSPVNTSVTSNPTPTTNTDNSSTPNNTTNTSTNSSSPTTSSIPNSPTLTSNENTIATLTIKNSTLNVRNNSNLSSLVVTQVHQGEKVFVIKILAGWLKIRTQNGMEGYISYP